MAKLIEDLRCTISACWYADARGTQLHFGTSAKSCDKPRWTTRTEYYSLLLSMLAEAVGTAPNRAADLAQMRIDRDEVVAAAGKQSAATLFYLVGGRAKHSLLRRLEDGDSGLVEALPKPTNTARPRRDVVDNLVTEAKVWHYWPNRTGWLRALADHEGEHRLMAAQTLVRVLADWASSHPDIGAVAGFSPPIATVEDLVTIFPGTHPTAAAAVLTRVVELAVGPFRTSPTAVLDAVRESLSALRGHQEAAHETLAAEATHVLTSVALAFPKLAPDDRNRLTDELAPQLLDLLNLMGQVS